MGKKVNRHVNFCSKCGLPIKISTFDVLIGYDAQTGDECLIEYTIRGCKDLDIEYITTWFHNNPRSVGFEANVLGHPLKVVKKNELTISKGQR